MEDALNDMEVYANEKIDEIFRKLYRDYDLMEAEMIKYYLGKKMIKKIKFFFLDGEISY